MTSRKRNEWLDADVTDEEAESVHDLELSQDSRVRRASKRRKISPIDDGESDASTDAEDSANIGIREAQDIPKIALDDSSASSPADVSSARDLSKFEKEIQTKSKKKKKLLVNSKTRASATGVIYLSRVPPFMKPQTVKHLLQPYGGIGRIFLTPEDPTSHSRRVKSGGNKKRSFTDGWVEFQSKRDAKLVAETLNAQIIGGKKGGWYHDDVWNMKYLRGFKWHHLTEQIANENAERAARLRAEIVQTTKENKRFVANVEMAKMLQGMKAKKRGKTAVDDTSGGSSIQAGQPRTKQKDLEKMHFRQNGVRSNTRTEGAPKEQPEEVRRVLAKIF